MWRDDVIKESPYATAATFDLCSWASSIICGVATSPIFTVVATLFGVIFWKYSGGRWAIGVLHGAVHLLIMLAVIGLSVPLNFHLLGIAPGGYVSWWARCSSWC